jgi:hypothetical protein
MLSVEIEMEQAYVPSNETRKPYMCVRSWGLARNRAFMERQDFGVTGESRPRCP